MKIYFAGSITGGRDDKDLYAQMIPMLKEYGEVLTEHIGNAGLTEVGEQEILTAQQIFERDVAWLREADVIVAEVTIPSLGVGYEIGLAESLGKRILCIYREREGKKTSAMLLGNPRINTITNYSDISELKEIFNQFFNLL